MTYDIRTYFVSLQWQAYVTLVNIDNAGLELLHIKEYFLKITDVYPRENDAILWIAFFKFVYLS